MTLLLSKALAAIGAMGIASTALGAIGNPKHFVEPTAVPSFGPSNWVTTFDANDDIVSYGSPDVTGTTNLWAVGDAFTTKQEFTDLYARRVNSQTANVDATTGFIHDGSTTLSTPTLTAHAPGYITSSGNFYSFGGDYGAHVNVANYGGPTNSVAGGTLLILQTSAGLNPDFRPLYNVGANVSYPDIDPGVLAITKQDGSALPTPAEVLDFDILFQDDDVASSFGPVPWQELIWTVWLPDYTGDLKIDFGIPVHSAFSSLRVDTAIGSMSGDPNLANFTVSAVPEPASLGVLGVASLTLLRRRSRRSLHR